MIEIMLTPSVVELSDTGKLMLFHKLAQTLEPAPV
jgi:hypothetical protein